MLAKRYMEAKVEVDLQLDCNELFDLFNLIVGWRRSVKPWNDYIVRICGGLPSW